jgi:hypothetical protein
MDFVAWALVGGFGLFMVGASMWRLEYEAPMEEALVTMHADRTRRRWIHGLMIPAVALTTAGLWGLAHVDPRVALGAGLYTVGAVPWLGALAFRLTVGEWAAESAASGEAIPASYRALSVWVDLGHTVHMGTAYAATVPVALGLAGTSLVVDWLPAAGITWAVVMVGLFALPRLRFVAEPPFWAHVFTFAVGLSMLLV